MKLSVLVSGTHLTKSHNSNIMKIRILICAFTDQVSQDFCTYHESCAAVPCVKLLSDSNVIMHVKVTYVLINMNCWRIHGCWPWYQVTRFFATLTIKAWQAFLSIVPKKSELFIWAIRRYRYTEWGSSKADILPATISLVIDIYHSNELGILDNQHDSWVTLLHGCNKKMRPRALGPRWLDTPEADGIHGIIKANDRGPWNISTRYCSSITISIDTRCTKSITHFSFFNIQGKCYKAYGAPIIKRH